MRGPGGGGHGVGRGVRATIHGDQAVVDIMPHNNGLHTAQGGPVRSRAADTTVGGNAGEWIDIGGALVEMVGH